MKDYINKKQNGGSMQRDATIVIPQLLKQKVENMPGVAIKQRDDFTPNVLTDIALSGREEDKINPAGYGKLTDLYNYFGGRPLTKNVLAISNYKPTNARDANAKYVSINDPQFRQQVVNNYNRVASGNIAPFYKEHPANSNMESMLKPNTYSVSGYHDHEGAALGHYIVSKGKDEHGDYISYYKPFDVSNQRNHSDVSEDLGAVKPFEVYDRIYLDKDGKPIAPIVNKIQKATTNYPLGDMGRVKSNQQGGLLDIDALRGRLQLPKMQQDNVPSRKVIDSVPTPMKNYLDSSAVTEQDVKDNKPGIPLAYPHSQGSIRTPYKTSIREDMINGLNKVDRNGDNVVFNAFTSIPKSALNLLRPDKYFAGVNNDSDIGNAFGRMAGDVLNAAPLAEPLGVAAKEMGIISRPTLTPLTEVNGRIIHYLVDDSKPLLVDKLKDKASMLMDKKFIPAGEKRVLPDNVDWDQAVVPSTTLAGIQNGKSIFTTRLIGDDRKIYGSIDGYTDKDRAWMNTALINVNPALQGNQLQDVLYQKAIEQAQSTGLAGVRSGDNLLSPAKTVKAQQRFNRVVFDMKNTDGIDHEVSGLTAHENPNVVQDWMAKYKDIPKFQPQQLSINDLLNKLKTPKLQQGQYLR